MWTTTSENCPWLGCTASSGGGRGGGRIWGHFPLHQEPPLWLWHWDCMGPLSALQATVFPTIFWTELASIYLIYSSILRSLFCNISDIFVILFLCFSLYKVMYSLLVDENMGDYAQFTILMSFLMSNFKEF